jgi:hypothetical protein
LTLSLWIEQFQVEKGYLFLIFLQKTTHRLPRTLSQEGSGLLRLAFFSYGAIILKKYSIIIERQHPGQQYSELQ